MSEGEVAVMEAVYEAWSRRDVDGLVALLHPDLEFHTSGHFPGLRPLYRGRDGMRRFAEEFGSAWESLSIVPVRFEERDDRIVSLWHFEGHGRDGVPVKREGGHVTRFRDGLIVDLRAFGSWSETLEAAARS